MVMDFDNILAKCGDFHRYQYLLLALFGIVNFVGSMHYFNQTIISFEPNHWCYHEKLENKSLREIEEIYSKLDKPSCTRLDDINGSEVIVSEKECEKWIYEYDYGYKSMNTELNWVCQSAWKVHVGQSMFFIGSICGTLIFGFLSDQFGRLPALILSNLSGFFGDLLTRFTTEVISFSICRLIAGLAADTNTVLMYIIVLEYIRPSMRSICLNLVIGIFYCMGLVVAPWIAVAAGDWKNYLVATTTPILCVIFFYPLVSESAQWLVTRDNMDGALLRLRRIAKCNGKTVNEIDFEEYKKYCEKQKSDRISEKKSNFIDMFRTPRLRKITYILFYKSMIITLCFDVVSRNVEGIGISPFIMFSLSSLSVLPASIFVMLLQDKIGRKAMASSSLFIGGIVTFSTGIKIAYEEQSNVTLLVVLQIIARFGAAIAFESGSQYATELIPTCVRGQGVAAVHVAGFAASFFSPYILYLKTYFKAMPSIILATLFFSGSFVCLLLPETTNRTLPQTLEEGEEFGKGERIFDFPCFTRKQRKSNEDPSEISHL